MNGMSILIQHRETKLYYNLEARWVASTEDAFDFPSPLTATKFSAENNLGDTEVVFIPHSPIALTPRNDADPRAALHPGGPRLAPE